MNQFEKTIKICIQTELGTIEAVLYSERAPITVANFVKNIESGLYHGGHFYRAARNENYVRPNNDKISVIQGGKSEEKRPPSPIAHESTRISALSHTDGILSMARNDHGTADTEFFICIGDNFLLDHLDSDNDSEVLPGYAAFGSITKGMDTVREIHSMETGSRRIGAWEKGWAPNWILPQLLNESVKISGVVVSG